MNEKALNLTFYEGEDLYSDGDIEDELLQIVQTHKNLEEYLQTDNRWPILYHLSKTRHNILNWYELRKDDSVLEIGSGCGAITGVLCRKAGKVTCIELSKRRSLINAARNREFDNFEIFVGNFENIELEEKYDYVTLIGVLEYAPSYISKGEPFSVMLSKVHNFLKPGGKVIIALENKFGLKYFAGAAEDHTGKYFDGIEDYQNTNYVRTFSKPELERLLLENGFQNLEFYYPVPDYKLPVTIYSDEYLPNKGDLRNISHVYDRDRYELFDEEIVFDQLCEDNMYTYFSNSFLVIAEGKQRGAL